MFRLRKRNNWNSQSKIHRKQKFERKGKICRKVCPTEIVSIRHTRQDDSSSSSSSSNFKFPLLPKTVETLFSNGFVSESGSSVLGGGIRENAIPEALYATIPDTPNASANETGNGQLNAQSRPVYAIPSMVSPPPTYDVAISKTWQVSDCYVIFLGEKGVWSCEVAATRVETHALYIKIATRM